MSKHTPVREPTVEDNSQCWAGMDGATAWHLIDRHADGWADVAKMMGEWLAANTPPAAPVQEHVAWVERWCGSGPDRGWWVWEAGLTHGNSVAYIGEGDFAERLTSLIVEKHNAAITRPLPAAPVLPEDWKLVPVEPTQEMLDAFKHRYKEGDFWRERIHGAVAAMLAAAPEQKGGAG